MEEGIAGFGKGLGVGTLGLVFKPFVGVFELLSSSTEGVANHCKTAEEVMRKRWMRVF